MVFACSVAISAFCLPSSWCRTPKACGAFAEYCAVMLTTRRTFQVSIASFLPVMYLPELVNTYSTLSVPLAPVGASTWACADAANTTSIKVVAIFMKSPCTQGKRVEAGEKVRLQNLSLFMWTLVHWPVPLHEPVQVMS